MIEYLSIIIGIVGIIIAVFFTYYFMKNSKKLLCVYIPSFSLINVNDKIRDKTEIKYEKKVVDNLSSITVKIFNIGFRGIKSENLKEPLELIFNDKVKILDHKLIKSLPENIKTDITDLNNSSKISFDLMNSGCYIVIEYIVTGEIKKEDKPNLQHKIEDIKKIKVKEGIIVNKRQHRQNYIDSIFLGGLSLLFTAVSFGMIPQFLTALSENGLNSTESNSILFLMIMMVIGSAATVNNFRIKFFNDRQRSIVID